MKKILQLFLLCFLNLGLHAQQGTQLASPNWIFPGLDPTPNTTSSKILNVKSNSLSNLPTGPNTWDYNGQIPQHTFASYTDYKGDLVFFVVDDMIYDHEGYNIDEITNTSTVANPSSSGQLDQLYLGSEMQIIPVPEECDKYYIVFVNENFSNRRLDKYGYYYVTIDFSIPSFYYPNRLGGITSNHLLNNNLSYGKAIEVGSGSIHNPNVLTSGLSLSFTPQENDERFLYLGGGTNIRRFIVDNNGFTDDNYDLNTYFNDLGYDLFTTVDGNGKFIDADIVILNDGNYRLVAPLHSGNPTWPVSTGFPANTHAIVVTIDGITGDFTDCKGIQFPAPGPSGRQHLKGLELSQDGRYLYASSNKAPFLHVVDLNQTITGNYFTTQALSSWNSSISSSDQTNFQKGNIETDRDGKLYFASISKLGMLANSNDPSSLWNGNAVTISLPEISTALTPENNGVLIPRQTINRNENSVALIVDQYSVYCADLTVNANIVPTSIGNPFTQGTWSNGSTTNGTTYTMQEGENLIYADVISQNGCTERFYITISTGFGTVSINASSTDYCPNSGTLTIDALTDGVTPNASLNINWTKDGTFYSSASSITADGPGEYCFVIEDLSSGCSAEEQCITITDNNCGSVNAAFNYGQVNQNPPFNFNMMVNSSETRPCAGHIYTVYDANNMIIEQAYFGSGILTTAFQYNMPYVIEHTIITSCTTVTRSEGIFISPRLKSPIQDENVSDRIIFPNPTQGSVTVKADFEYTSYVVRNSIGQIVKNGIDLTIDLSNLKDGMYFISLLDSDMNIITSKKIIKN